MSYLNIDILIVAIFLVTVLLVGWVAGKNIRDINDYTLANRSYGVGILTITTLATYITGSQIIGYVGYVFERGVLPFIATFFCGVAACFLFIAHYITPRMHYFEGCLTLAEVMGKLYGTTVRIWVGILGSFYCVVMAALQLIWMSYIGELINLPKSISMFSGAFLLLAYTTRGGIKAIAIADIIQFIMITIFISITIHILLKKLYVSNIGIQEALERIPENNFKFWKHPGMKNYFISCLQGIFPAFPLSFPFIQRMLMAKNKRQLACSQYLTIGYLGIFYILLTCIGVLTICLKNLGDLGIGQQNSKALIYVIKNYFPEGLVGIATIGLLAAVMSTADAFLQSAGVLVGYDVVPLLSKKEIDVVRISRYATFFLGVIAFLFAISQQVLPRVQYGNIHWGKGINIARDFVGVVFTLPLIAGILGLKTDARSFFISMISTWITCFLGKLFLPDIWFMPVVIIVNASSFFLAHYSKHKKWATVKRDTIPIV